MAEWQSLQSRDAGGKGGAPFRYTTPTKKGRADATAAPLIAWVCLTRVYDATSSVHPFLTAVSTAIAT
ncbi:hypothetical protein HNR56_000229 [Roseospira marina]|nr:hypothetical protein [Roseospira marina]MBB5085557.1 hypothetical protein [Roseospira marina]